MKKRDLGTLALLGISAGLLVGSCQQKNTPRSNTSAAEQLSPDMQAFYNSLGPDAQRQFKEMDPQRRAMSIQMLQQAGPGQNSCRGLGGCGTSAHGCAGKNTCKGQGGPTIQNPNQAVNVQYQNQMGQRNQMNQNLPRN